MSRSTKAAKRAAANFVAPPLRTVHDLNDPGITTPPDELPPDSLATPAEFRDDMTGDDAPVMPRPKMKLSQARLIRLDEIEVDDSDNPRRDAQSAEIAQLANGMEITGSTYSPILVEELPPGSPFRYRRLGGSRRFFAAQLLQWTEIEAKVFLGTELDADMVRALDNETPKRLKSYELAAWFTKMKTKYSFTTNQLLEEIKSRGHTYSRSYAENLMSAYNGLQEPILDNWSKGHELLTTDLLNALKMMPPSRQLDVWERVQKGDDWRTIRHDKANEDKTPQPANAKPIKALSPALFSDTSMYVRMAPIPNKVRTDALALLQFIGGHTRELVLSGRTIVYRQDNAIVRGPQPDKKVLPGPTRAQRSLAKKQRESKEKGRAPVRPTRKPAAVRKPAKARR